MPYSKQPKATRQGGSIAQKVVHFEASHFDHQWYILTDRRQRVGRAIRKPTVEGMLSYASDHLGRGWVFALNNALDETGSVLGPLVVALILFRNGKDHYPLAYAILLIPAVLALFSVNMARLKFPKPTDLQRKGSSASEGFTRSYWVSMVAGAFLAAGLVSFELISYHLAKTHIVALAWIPFFFAMASAFGVLASLILGRLYDKHGLPVLLAAVGFSSFFSPLVFFGGFYQVLAGLLLWAVGYATQDTLLKALIASMLPKGGRSLAFGLFYIGYGGGWLVGSSATGLLYSYSIPAVILFSVGVQWMAIPLFFWGHPPSQKGTDS